MLAISVLRRKKIPFFLNADGGFINEDESERKQKIKRRFISAATWWLSTAPQTSKYLMAYGADEKRIFEYPFSSVKRVDALSEALTTEERLLVRGRKVLRCETLFISVGQFVPRKGYYEFLTQWVSKDRGTIGLAIIGGGVEEALYKEITKDYPNVWILPFLKKQVLADYFKAADAFVLPTKEDIWGLVVNEAMSFGLPVFSTTSCIAAEKLKGSGVQVFPVGDNDALISAMEYFAMSENRDEMISDVVERGREYTIEKMAQAHIEIFKDVLKGNG